MPGWLRVSTAVTVKVGPFFDDVDFKTLETGLSITAAEILLSKNGAGYAGKNDSTAASPDASTGDYYITLNATDTNSAGILRLWIQKAGALVVWDSFMVLGPYVYDAMMGFNPFQADVLAWAGTLVATPDTAGYPKVTIKDGTGAGELDLTSGVVLAKDHAGANLATAAQVAALENVSAAEVKTQVVDALTVDTYAEIGQEAPAATTTFSKMWRFLYKAARNKVTQTGSEYKLYNDAGDTVDQKSALTDDTVVYQKGKVGSGP